MDGESKEPPSFKNSRLELEIAANGREKSGGGGVDRVLGFEPTVTGYIQRRALSEVPTHGRKFR